MNFLPNAFLIIGQLDFSIKDLKATPPSANININIAILQLHYQNQVGQVFSRQTICSSRMLQVNKPSYLDWILTNGAT